MGAETQTQQIPPIVSEIAQRCQIQGLALAKGRCELLVSPDGVTVRDLQVGLRGHGSRHPSKPDVLVCSFGLDVWPQDAADEKKIRLAQISCDYIVQYHFAEKELLERVSGEDIEVFAAYNTSFHVWPYAREFVQSMAARMGLPPVLLPVFRPANLIPPRDQWVKLAEPGPGERGGTPETL